MAARHGGMCIFVVVHLLLLLLPPDVSRHVMEVGVAQGMPRLTHAWVAGRWQAGGQTVAGS